MLKEKAERFNADPEITSLFEELNDGGDSMFAAGYSKQSAARIHG